MFLTRHQTDFGPRWALDGRYLPRNFTLTPGDVVEIAVGSLTLANVVEG